jgi:hypothetical protein
MNARANAQRVMQAGSMAKEGQIQEALVMYQKALDLNDKLHGPERYSSNVFILYIIIIFILLLCYEY